MIEEANRNCRNCIHCFIEYKDSPVFDKCLFNATDCHSVLTRPRLYQSCSPDKRIHWVPKPPTLWEKFLNLLSEK